MFLEPINKLEPMFILILRWSINSLKSINITWMGKIKLVFKCKQNFYHKTSMTSYRTVITVILAKCDNECRYYPVTCHIPPPTP